jgi:hypothetical protein
MGSPAVSGWLSWLGRVSSLTHTSPNMQGPGRNQQPGGSQSACCLHMFIILLMYHCSNGGNIMQLRAWRSPNKECSSRS